MKTIFLQVVQTTDSLANFATSAVNSNESFSLWDLTLKGGPVMIPITLVSLVSVYLIVERYIFIRRFAKDETSFVKSIKDHIYSGNIEAAKNLSQNTDSPIARMIEKGISRIGKPLDDIEKAVENVGNLEIFKMEKGLSILATCASAAPMLGFLGTVTGMIKAFYNMAKAGDQIKINMLANGMYEAMVTTVAGLIVGIFTLVCYNLLSGMIQKIIFKMENSSMEFLDLLHEPAK